MPENIHPHCAGPQHDRGGATGWPQIEVKVHELPYNPEWPARITDAAVFCTYECLADWAVERVEQRSPKGTEAGR